MADALYGWLQDLACYFLLLSVVMNFLPDNSYKKYIQYYMGLLLILVILSPLLKITSLQTQIDAYIEEFQNISSEKQEWETKAKQWEADWQEKMEEKGEVQEQ